MIQPPSPEKIILNGIVDTTLREGSQSPCFSPGHTRKLEIIRHLAEVGVDEIELGVATPRSPELVSLVREASLLPGRKSRLSLWSRCCDEDIDFAARCRPDVLSLSIPVSDIHLHDKMDRDRPWVLATLERSVKRALDQGIKTVSLGLEDATRAGGDFLARVIETADRAGVQRVRLADTVGVATPGRISSLIRQVTTHTSLPVGIHTHNDFGMATANAVAALEAGARWVDATTLGLGERSGNCRLEEIVGFVTLATGGEQYNPQKLLPLCRLVAQTANISITPNHPVIGEQIFTCKTGLHVQGIARNPATYEPYAPEKVGRKRTLLFGSQTGVKAILTSLSSRGFELPAERAEHLVRQVRLRERQGKDPLCEKSLMELARKNEPQSILAHGSG